MGSGRTCETCLSCEKCYNENASCENNHGAFSEKARKALTGREEKGIIKMLARTDLYGGRREIAAELRRNFVFRRRLNYGLETVRISAHNRILFGGNASENAGYYDHSAENAQSLRDRFGLRRRSGSFRTFGRPRPR